MNHSQEIKTGRKEGRKEERCFTRKPSQTNVFAWFGTAISSGLNS